MILPLLLLASIVEPTYELGPTRAHVMEMKNGEIVCFSADPDQVPSREPDSRPGRAQHLPQVQYILGDAGNTNVILSFDPDPPDEARPALQAGAEIWASYLKIKVPLTIHVEWKDLSVSRYLAYALPGMICPVSPSRCDPLSLANQLHEKDWLPSQADMTITFNSNVSWHYGIDGEAPDGTFNLISVFLHEIGHGLGFSSSMTVPADDPTQAEYFEAESGAQFTYDKFMWTAEHGQLIDQEKIGNPSVELKQAVTSGDLYWGAPGWTNTRGEPMRAVDVAAGMINLWAPWFFQAGTSVSHLSGPDHPQEIMGVWGPHREPDIAPSPLVLAMLHDMGWELQPRALDRPETCGVIEVVPWQDRFTWSLKARIVPGTLSSKIQWVLDVENVSDSDLSWKWIQIDFLDADGFQLAQDKIDAFTSPRLGDPGISAGSTQTWRGETRVSDPDAFYQVDVSSPEGQWESDAGAAIDRGEVPEEVPENFRWSFKFREDQVGNINWQLRVRNLSSEPIDWPEGLSVSFVDEEGYTQAYGYIVKVWVAGESTRTFQGFGARIDDHPITGYRVTLDGDPLENEEEW